MAAIDEKVASLENKVASLLTRMASAEGGVRRLDREDSLADTRYDTLLADVRNLQTTTAQGLLVPAGASRAGSINGVIASASAEAVADPRRLQRVVRLIGDYELEDPIVLQDLVILDLERANLIPTFTGGADTITNAVIKADGSINTTKMNTTLTASVFKNQLSIVVAAAGTIAAGDYFVIEGHNDASAYPQDALGESTGTAISLSEICQVSSAYASGTTIPLAWPLRQHHGSNNCTVRALTPVIGAAVKGGRIWGSEGGVTNAVGVLGRYALDLEIEGLEASGLSRMAINLFGSKDVSVRGYRNRGGNNGWFMAQSVIGMQVSDFDGYQGVARIHANGAPLRYPFQLRDRCTDVDIDDIHFTNTAAGMMIGGGEHVCIGTIDITDVRPTTAVYDSMVTGGDIDNGGYFIMGFGTGNGPINNAEFAFDVTIDKIRVEDVAAPYEAFWTATTPLRARAVLLHDILNGHVGDVSVINRGVTGDTHITSGVVVSDFSGHINSIASAGFVYGLTFENSANSVVIDRYDFKGVGGQSPNSSIPILCTHITPSAQTIHIREVSIANAFSFFRTAGSFAGDYRFRIDNVVYDGYEWTDVIIGEITADVATGDIMEIDSTATDNSRQRVIQTAAAAGFERRLAVMVSGDDVAGSSYALICPLPARLATVKATAAVVDRGGVLRHSGTGTRTCEQDAAATHPIGISRDYKAAGAGLIRIGPINP